MTIQAGRMCSNYYQILIYFLKSNVWIEFKLPEKTGIERQAQGA